MIMVVLTLQVIDNVAMVVLEESAPGSQVPIGLHFLAVDTACASCLAVIVIMCCDGSSMLQLVRHTHVLSRECRMPINTLKLS